MALPSLGLLVIWRVTLPWIPKSKLLLAAGPNRHRPQGLRSYKEKGKRKNTVRESLASRPPLSRLHLGLLSLGQSGVTGDQDSPSPSTLMPRRFKEGWESDKHWKGRLPPSPGRSLRPVSAGARSPPTFHLPCSLWGKERSAAAAPPLASWRTAAPLKHIQVCTPPSRGGLYPFLGTQEQE